MIQREYVGRTYRKENPLKLNTVIIRFGGDIETKLVVLIIMLLQVQENCSRLEDDEIVSGSVH